MKTYNKRIAFYITSQHMIPHGGIGSFFKGFYDLAKEQNWMIDVIADKELSGKAELLTEYAEGVRYFYPDNPQPYTAHNAQHMLAGDSMNFAKVMNFQEAQLKAFSYSLYDAIILNAPEALLALTATDLHKWIPTVYYTHQDNAVYLEKENSKIRTFSESYVELQRLLMTCEGLNIGTQSNHNVEVMNRYKDRFKFHNILSLPLLLPEHDLLKAYNNLDKRSGIMFIGRFEPRKQPKIFVEAILKAQLPAKILTNENGKKKFEETFKKMASELNVSIPSVEYKVSIIGKEKVDFIKSAKLGFHPSQLESYGYSAWETLHSCPTFLFKEFEWHKAFLELNVKLTSKKTFVDDLIAAYNDTSFNEIKQLVTMDDYNIKVKQAWTDFVNNSKPYEQPDTIYKTSEFYKLLSEKNEYLELSEYYFKILKRNQVSYGDILTVVNKTSIMQKIDTFDGSFLALNKNATFNGDKKPIENSEQNDDELFCIG